jgi:protein-S-isoprenylcysteine O-methyltransferase Ste14
MILRERIERQGNWIFRYRSYLPLAIILIIAIAMRDYTYFRNDYKLDLLWELGCLFIAFTGLAIRMYTIGYVPKGTSGRNTQKQVADVLNTTGIYSVVRNPLYLGNFLMWFAVGLLTRAWWVSALIIMVFYAYHERIIFAEEEFLRRKFGEEFLRWASVTPAFIPNFKLWVSSDREFSLNTVIKREYHGFFGIILIFSFLEAMRNYSVQNIFQMDFIGSHVLWASVAVYLVLRLLTRYTHILEVEGR